MRIIFFVIIIMFNYAYYGNLFPRKTKEQFELKDERRSIDEMSSTTFAFPRLVVSTNYEKENINFIGRTGNGRGSDGLWQVGNRRTHTRL